MKGFIYALAVILTWTDLGTCSPLSWNIEQTETLDMRYERDVGGASGDGSGDGNTNPCGDDEDSPCDVIPTSSVIPAPHIRSLHVETTITTRYVSTTVITDIENDAAVSQDSDFSFRLSKGAFISDFFMVIKGVKYQANVRKKEEAQKAYNEARRQGLSAGHVKQSENDLNKFETNVNLSPNTTATFHLSFQELLRRKNGVFQHTINLYPKEVVRKLRADVYITEPQGISFANISWVQDVSLTDDFIYDALTVKRQSDTRVHAIFTPSREDQEGLAETGLQGDLVITYDVVHDSGAGHIEIVNGYFVHHISPEGLPVTPKHVIFVIDISGSMNSGTTGIYGTKLHQTKLAMATIIEEIREFDYFNIICFSDRITRWKDDMVEATSENKMNAKTFVDNLRASGGTDIHSGLMDAITRMKGLIQRNNRNSLSMIILLTDGEPTSGITDRSEIIKRITMATDHQIALFSLAFGASADYSLLQKLSGHNQGLARQIYPDSSPSLQLSGFYKEVATPLLHNVVVRYPEYAVDLNSLTKSNFISYFEGTEIVIAGKIKDDYEGNELPVLVSGNSVDVQLEWELIKTIEKHNDDADDSVLKPHQVNDFAQRLWAYVTIKDLLSKLDIALTSEEKDSLRYNATQLALKYKFVTPLTSLIVIKPEGEQNYDDIVEVDDEDADVYIANTPSYQMQARPVLSLMLAAPQMAHYRPHPAARYHTISSHHMARPIARPAFHHLSVGIAPPRPNPPLYTSRIQPVHNVGLASSIAVDGDPHVFVAIPDRNTSICFEITGENGMIMNLLSDDKLGININAVIHSFSGVSEDKPRSFFSTFGVTLGNHSIAVTPRSIETGGGITLDWNTKWRMAFDDFILRVEPVEKILEIYNTKGVSMNIRRHSDLRTKKKGSRRQNHVEHLGLYIQETTGFTETLSGILGQFYSSAHEFRIEPMVQPKKIPGQEFTKVATLVADGTKIPVVWHERNHRYCWHAGSDGGGNLNPTLFERDRLF